MSQIDWSKYNVTEHNGEDHVLIPVRQLGMFNVSYSQESPILDPRSRLPGPGDWSKIGFCDVTQVEPPPPGTQAGFPANWCLVPPGGIDWACQLRPTGDVFFMGLRIIAQQVQATVDGETGEWLMDDPVVCFNAPVSGTIIKATNTDVVTGGDDTGADLGAVTLGGTDFVLIHGISNENPLLLNGKVLPSSFAWTVVQVSAPILTVPRQGAEITPMLQLANKVLTKDQYDAIMRDMQAALNPMAA